MGVGEARASSFDLYGFSSRARGMGNAQVALGINYDAAYYNPANILSRKQTHFGMGLDLVVPALDFTPVQGAFEPLMPDTSAGFHLGASTPISGAFADRLGFGIALFHPLTSGTKIESIDPATPYFYRYQNLPDKLVLALALAGEPTPWLRIGAGIQVLATFDGEVNASLSLAEGRFTRESIDVEIVPAASPTAGLALGPFEGLRFGATWRHELELDYQLPVVATIEGIGDLDVYVHGVSLYTPSQLALGVGWESAPAPEPGVSVEVGLTWELWSAAPPAGADFVLTVDDSEVRPPTDPQDQPEELIAVRSTGAPVGARDTVTPRIGVEWRPDTTWTARAGWFWRPTPLPTPIYQTNLLDATAHVFSLGAGVTFGDPIGVTSSPLMLDLTVQLTRLDQRAVQKDPTGRPTGAYTFGGLIWHIGLDLRHDYY
ncbi:MAG: hypothetical protein EP329_05370 [Deltaproteobacteria bacterium]|nr:MAG: hypothetical protein EP329_05370 [Deltaproteobacteria bacterium]